MIDRLIWIFLSINQEYMYDPSMEVRASNDYLPTYLIMRTLDKYGSPSVIIIMNDRLFIHLPNNQTRTRMLWLAS